MKPAYYNEFDKYAAQWLRNLITLGVIPPGDVDERSIEDVRPDDLRGYGQCHFFAGIGVWAYALREIGWPDDRPIWTGSCPRQPFSTAGAGNGFDDERHLWPAFFQLIAQRGASIVVGEQVASRDAGPWIDLVHADMEALGYAFGAVPFPSASVGAPHIRDRLYWVADADQGQRRRRSNSERLQSYGQAFGRQQSDGFPKSDCTACRMDHASRTGLEGLGRGHQAESGRIIAPGSVAEAGELGGVGNTAGERCGETRRTGTRPEKRLTDAGASISGMADHAGDGRCEQCANSLGSDERSGTEKLGERFGGSGIFSGDGSTGPTNGFWRAADWLACRDGKWRPVEPGTFPLVDGVAASMGRGRSDWQTPAGAQGFGHRAGRLKGYGNAINAQQAIIFLKAALS